MFFFVLNKFPRRFCFVRWFAIFAAFQVDVGCCRINFLEKCWAEKRLLVQNVCCLRSTLILDVMVDGIFLLGIAGSYINAARWNKMEIGWKQIVRSFRSNNKKKWKELSDKIVSFPVRRLRTVRTWRSSTNPAKREEHNLSALSVSEFSHNVCTLWAATHVVKMTVQQLWGVFFCTVWGPFGLQSLWTGLQTPGLCRGFFRVKKSNRPL